MTDKQPDFKEIARQLAVWHFNPPPPSQSENSNNQRLRELCERIGLLDARKAKALGMLGYHEARMLQPEEAAAIFGVPMP